MTAPDCCEADDPLAGALLFASVTAVAVGAALFGHHVINETLRRQDCPERGR